MRPTKLFIIAFLTIAFSFPALAQTEWRRAGSIESYKQSCVAVRSNDGWGSGFSFHSAEGYSLVLTNQHVADVRNVRVVHTSTGMSYDGQVITSSKMSDLAVIRIAAMIHPLPILDSTSSLPPGATVIIPSGYHGRVFQTTVAEVRDRSVLVNGYGLGGYSGSPYIYDGKVVGLHRSSSGYGPRDRGAGVSHVLLQQIVATVCIGGRCYRVPAGQQPCPRCGGYHPPTPRQPAAVAPKTPAWQPVQIPVSPPAATTQPSPVVTLSPPVALTPEPAAGTAANSEGGLVSKVDKVVGVVEKLATVIPWIVGGSAAGAASPLLVWAFRAFTTVRKVKSRKRRRRSDGSRGPSKDPFHRNGRRERSTA